jgi:predicted lipoprotein with Yx(FWY)xxD motif
MSDVYDTYIDDDGTERWSSNGQPVFKKNKKGNWQVKFKPLWESNKKARRNDEKGK